MDKNERFEEYVQKLVFDAKRERYKLKKRVEKIEKELEGVGVRDYSLTEEQIRILSIGD